jgi:hypothetical protein
VLAGSCFGVDLVEEACFVFCTEVVVAYRPPVLAGFFRINASAIVGVVRP